MSESDALAVLAAYLDHKARTAINNHTRQPVQAKTLNLYLQAAAAYLRSVTTLSIHLLSNPNSSTPRLHAFFADILQSRAKWAQPYPKRLPYTYAMFSALNRLVRSALSSSKASHLDLLTTVFDWVRLGIFTGSRAGEYAQTVASSGSFSRVPLSWAPPPEWRNMPVAFIASDFTFTDKALNVIPLTQALKSPKLCHRLQLRFRYDKGPTNFSIRRFCRGQSFLCPVSAALSILLRASRLGVPKDQPVGVFRSCPTGRYTYLRSSEIIDVMRDAVRAAYPDPNHYYRLNIKAVVAHSNRVTAAVALYANKMSIEEIAFRLRWKPESVQHYIRECSQMVDDITAATIQGALIL
jgi:hypothetical protein